MTTEAWFVKVEVELTTGRSITASLTRDEAGMLALRVAGRSGPRNDLELVQACVATLEMRMEKGTGFLALPDSAGRTWIIRAGSIAAVAVEHRLDVPGRHEAIRVGFTPEP